MWSEERIPNYLLQIQNHGKRSILRGKTRKNWFMCPSGSAIFKGVDNITMETAEYQQQATDKVL